MKIQLFSVPYDSGKRDFRMGRGPKSFVDFGLKEILERDGHTVQVEEIHPSESISSDIESAFELNRILSSRVRSVMEQQAFPLVLSGNCICSTGTYAGASAENTGMVWLDAHGDFNTPETTISGFLDGMALAVITGRCHREFSKTIPDFQPLAEHKVILLGARDFDPAERRLIDGSGIALISSSFVRNLNVIEALKPALHAMESRVKKVHLHIDLDVLDSREVPANQYSSPNGLFVGETELALRLIQSRFPVSSFCMAAYDPQVDPRGKCLEAGVKFARIVCRDRGSRGPV